MKLTPKMKTRSSKIGDEPNNEDEPKNEEEPKNKDDLNREDK